MSHGDFHTPKKMFMFYKHTQESLSLLGFKKKAPRFLHSTKILKPARYQNTMYLVYISCGVTNSQSVLVLVLSKVQCAHVHVSAFKHSYSGPY